MIDRIVAASVKVTIEQDGRRLSSGSGVVIASRPRGVDTEAVSYILTAAHVLEGRDDKQLYVRFSGPHVVRGRFVATVPYRGRPEVIDLAIVRVAGIAVPPAAFQAEDRVRLGEEILVVGFPWGKRMGLFSGIVSQVPVGRREEGGPEEAAEQSIVIDASSSNGVSGGGVFCASTGRLLGIVEGYQTASIAVKGSAQTYSVKVPMPGETFVVPMAQIGRFLDQADVAELSALLKEPAERRD